MDMTMPVHMDMASMGGMYLANYRNWQASGGFGDTGGYALFKLWDNGNHHVHITQGISAPTGSVNQRQEFNLVNYYSYDMQMGSGTWDYKPSLTYTGHADDWSWGGQLSATHRLQAQNAYGFRYGDILQGTAWGGYQLTSWLNTTVRGVYTGQSHLTGSHQLYKDGVMFMPEDSPVNYGGDFVDVGFGLTGNLPFKPFIGHSFSFEWLQPVYTRVNGYQLDRTGALAATWNYAFN